MQILMHFHFITQLLKRFLCLILIHQKLILKRIHKFLSIILLNLYHFNIFMVLCNDFFYLIYDLFVVESFINHLFYSLRYLIIYYIKI